jgi:hypothetical protein
MYVFAAYQLSAVSPSKVTKIAFSQWQPSLCGVSYHHLPYSIGYQIRLRSEEACRAVAEVQCLDLHGCSLADRGVALLKSVREGRGPKGFYFDSIVDGDDVDEDGWATFDSLEWYISFLNALGRGNSYIERLDFSNIHIRDGIPQALAAALC